MEIKVTEETKELGYMFSRTIMFGENRFRTYIQHTELKGEHRMGISVLVRFARTNVQDSILIGGKQYDHVAAEFCARLETHITPHGMSVEVDKSWTPVDSSRKFALTRRGEFFRMPDLRDCLEVVRDVLDAYISSEVFNQDVLAALWLYAENQFNEAQAAAKVALEACESAEAALHQARVAYVRAPYPDRDEIRGLLETLRDDIGEEYRASVEDTEPSMMVTFGFTPKTGAWGYQTGDNSFTGGAYNHPDWSVITLYRETDLDDAVDKVFSGWDEVRP